MKPYVLVAASVAALAPIQAHAAPSTTKQFSMIESPGPKAAGCLPNAKGTVTDHSFGNFENLEVVVTGLPPNNGFDFFIIQVPNAPFGAAWYMGDITTDSTGTGVGNFVGRFSKETFIISLGATPAPNTFPDPPAVVPEAVGGVATNPVQMYHLGLWFDSAAEAQAAGCTTALTHTPFNGEHNAGIQILNTANFPNLAGPLIALP